MKKILLIATISCAASMSFAQIIGTTPGSDATAPQGGRQSFEARKAQEIARLQDHINRAQARLSCVQNAQNHAALRACNQKS